MDVFESKKNGWLILELKGRMDALTAPQIREKIIGVIDQGEKRLLLDFTGLDYVSSAGIRVLFEVADKIQEQKGKIGCYGVNEYVRHIFNLSDITSEIAIFNEQEEAF
jgi:anti-sigma B factor antagonist